VKASEGFIACPGGWGTNDELYEALVLIQTAKIQHFPVVLFDAAHWEPFRSWSRTMIREGLIGADDLDIVSFTDDPAEAIRIVLRCYRRECAHVA
jgi:predicted Rossmann-fold nucleotide-binding protein